MKLFTAVHKETGILCREDGAVLMPGNKPTVDHINRNRADNWIYNLRFATHQEQRENSSTVINRADYGVREKDDRKAYQKAYEAAHREQVNAWHREYRRKKREALNGK